MWDVHTTAIEVFVHVAQEVRQLEGVSEIARRADCGLVRRLKDGQHHFADHGCRTIHVDEEVIPRLILLDRQVHRHAAQESTKASLVDLAGLYGVDDRSQDGIARLPCRQVGEEAVAEILECTLTGLNWHGTEVVNDVVCIATEPVQRMHVPLLFPWQHLGRPVVRRAMALVELTTQFITLCERELVRRQ